MESEDKAAVNYSVATVGLIYQAKHKLLSELQQCALAHVFNLAENLLTLKI